MQCIACLHLTRYIIANFVFIFVTISRLEALQPLMPSHLSFLENFNPKLTVSKERYLPVSVALIIDQIRRVLVRRPLHDARLSFLAVEGERPLEGAEGFVILDGLVRVLLPLAKTTQTRRL